MTVQWGQLWHTYHSEIPTVLAGILACSAYFLEVWYGAKWLSGMLLFAAFQHVILLRLATLHWLQRWLAPVTAASSSAVNMRNPLHDPLTLRLAQWIARSTMTVTATGLCLWLLWSMISSAATNARALIVVLSVALVLYQQLDPEDEQNTVKLDVTAYHHLNSVPADEVQHWVEQTTTPELHGDAVMDLIRLYICSVTSSTLDKADGTLLVITEQRKAQGKVRGKAQTQHALQALVFVTCVHEYDLIEASGSTLTPIVKKWLKNTLGSQSSLPWRPLVTTLALIGFQWPFRSGLFMARSATVPYAAVLNATLRWMSAWRGIGLVVLPCAASSSAPATATCDITCDTLAAAGMLSVPLAPSYRVDLRPYKGLNVNERWPAYVRQLKLQYRRNWTKHLKTFEAAGATVHRRLHWGYDEARLVTSLCQRVAQKRSEAGETKMLLTPSPLFVMKLASEPDAALLLFLSMEQKAEEEKEEQGVGEVQSPRPHRELLIVKQRNDVIASCVLFKFPNKLMTSDIKGLDYERCKPAHVYFVMLAHVIQLALEEGYDWVDFGPTTATPKIEIGCQPVSMSAGLWCSQPLLSLAMSRAAQRFTSQMMTGNRRVVAPIAPPSTQPSSPIQSDEKEKVDEKGIVSDGSASPISPNQSRKSQPKIRHNKPKLTREAWEQLQRTHQASKTSHPSESQELMKVLVVSSAAVSSSPEIPAG